MTFLYLCLFNSALVALVFSQKRGVVFRDVVIRHSNSLEQTKFAVSLNTDKTRRDQCITEGTCIMVRKSALTECYNVFIKLLGAEKQYTAGPNGNILFSVCRCMQTHKCLSKELKHKT